ncbi:YiiG family protein [Stenotrophomonas sp. YAU14A_MKIMI4_1]|uniref:YiiG family protein n=1 Tax=Stenotrophomonas sp. YAU14A_MKIMI4_1 TaxID=2072408 RepID=UPI000D5401DA|nr:YiiG family protein [Stenotrophomonas sp. YAU14A_MKIMI4_1]AWH30360.1 hypothetical protein C1931_16320 [Stenotrophomonas sp. YAU14A_MKIMI4_1]
MKTPLRSAALVAALSLALVACGKLPGAAGPAEHNGHADAADASADVSDADAAELAMTTKLNAYIDCYNDVDSGLHQGIDYYTSWMADPKAGPSGREDRPIGPPDLTAADLKNCDTKIASARAAQPPLPVLDAAAQQYLDSLHALQPLAHAGHDYYSREDYQDDDFARGKDMHAPLMTALMTFAEHSQAFSNALEAQNMAEQNAALEAMKQRGELTREYYRMAMMRDAKALIDVMAEDRFDVAQAQTLLDAFNRISDEAHAAVGGQEPGRMQWNSFEHEAEVFRRDAKWRLERVSGKRPFTDIEKKWLAQGSDIPSGSPGKLLQTYNTLVDESNRQ